MRHAKLSSPPAAPGLSLPVAMIEPAFHALLVQGVGPTPLSCAILFAAPDAAIAMAAVAVRADEKHRATLFVRANSLPENRFVVNRRHAFSQAGGRQRQRLRGRVEIGKEQGLTPLPPISRMP